MTVVVKNHEKEILISFANLLLNINNQDNYKIIKNNISNQVVLNFLTHFSDNDLNQDTLNRYLNKNNNMENIKTNILEVINNNHSVLLIDLEEQYFSVKKNIYYYHCFHDALFFKKITRSPYLEAEFNHIEQNFKKLKSLFEPEAKSVYEDSLALDISNNYNLSMLKKSIDILEKDTIQYKKKLCSYLNFPTSQWKKEFNNYCTHLKSITIDEIEQINRFTKRSLLSFEKETVLDSISSTLQENLFVKIKKINSNYLLTYSLSYIDKVNEGNFCKKIIGDVFENGLINQWKHYRFYFSKNLRESLYEKIKDDIPSINKIDYNIALDNYIEKSFDFNDILIKSIKEAYRKKDTNEQLIKFDFKTSFIRLNYKFITETINIFHKKFENNIDELKNFILDNQYHNVESTKVSNTPASPFDGLLKKHRI